MTAVPAAVRWRITWLGYGAILLVGLNNGWLGPFLPQIAQARGIALDRAGGLVSALYVGFLLAVLASGQLVDRWGGRAALTLGVTLLSAGLFGLAAAPGLPLMLAGALVVGLGHGVLDVGSHVVIAALNRDRLAAALNSLNFFFGVGAFLGPLLVGLALRGGVSYGLTFAAAAAAAAALAVLLATTPLRHEGTAAAASAGSPFARPVLWLLGGVLLLYVGAEVGIATWLFSYLTATGGLDEPRALSVVSLFWIGLIAGRLLSGRLAGRVTTERLTLGVAAVAALALAALAFAPAWPPVQAAAVTLVGLGFAPIFPNVIALGAARFPHQVGTATATIIALGALGGIAGPWLMGRALVLATPRAAMALALAAVVLMLGLCWLVTRLPGEVAPRTAAVAESCRAR